MSVNVDVIRELREKTGAGVMDCRRAIESADGDVDKAIAVLKERGLVQMQKRQDREVTEGRVFLSIDNGSAVLLHLGCETDFVARNAIFIGLGNDCLALARNSASVDVEMVFRIQDAAARIRENIVLKGLKTLQAGPGERLFSYVHGEGRIGVVIRLGVSDPSAWDSPTLRQTAADLALHVAAYGPLHLSRDTADPRYVAEKESEFLSEAQSLGKPAKMVPMIARGKLDKHMAAVCLLEQGYIRDESSTVADVLGALKAGGGPDIRVTGFLYERVGG